MRNGLWVVRSGRVMLGYVRMFVACVSILASGMSRWARHDLKERIAGASLCWPLSLFKILSDSLSEPLSLTSRSDDGNKDDDDDDDGNKDDDDDDDAIGGTIVIAACISIGNSTPSMAAWVAMYRKVSWVCAMTAAAFDWAFDWGFDWERTALDVLVVVKADDDDDDDDGSDDEEIVPIRASRPCIQTME